MIHSFPNFLTPIIVGSIIFSLNACNTSSVQQQNNDNSVTNENTPPSQTTDEKTDPNAVQLTFGVYTADKPTTVVREFRPILNLLEEKMSQIIEKPVEIKMDVANTYEKGIKDIATGEVDFSLLGPASYVTAKKENPNLSILAIQTKGGEKVFNGIIAVHEDSEIQNVNQLVSKSFAFGDQLSTIGRYLSQQHLVENGITSSNLSDFDYLERHDKVGTAIDLRQFDAGALKESTFNKLVENGAQIRAIAKFPNVEKPWVGSSTLSPQMREALTESLLTLNSDQSLGKTKFVLGEDQDYQKIREAIDNNTQFFSN